jgi:hypothetical protein
VVQGQPRQNSSRDPISKNKQSWMDWRCGSSGRAPALQMQSPEFKNQSHQKEVNMHMSRVWIFIDIATC